MFLEKQHHIAIIATDYSKSKEFYVDKLGFEIVSEAYRPEKDDYLRMLRKGETILELFIEPDAPARITNPEARGLWHLAFYEKDIEAAAAWLNSMGIATDPIKEDKANGGRYTFFRDPDGLPLELHD